MKTVIEAIKERRSIRKYEDREVSEEIIKKICELGLMAPSGMNKKSPIIIAIKDKKMRDRLSKLNASFLNSSSDPFYGAPVVLIVLADKNIPTYIYDGSCVIENLLLASYAYGLGSCWIHRAKEEFNSEEGKQILKELGIEGNYEGIGHVILGYPAEKKEKKDIEDNRIVWSL